MDEYDVVTTSDIDKSSQTTCSPVQNKCSINKLSLRSRKRSHETSASIMNHCTSQHDETSRKAVCNSDVYLDKRAGKRSSRDRIKGEKSACVSDEPLIEPMLLSEQSQTSRTDVSSLDSEHNDNNGISCTAGESTGVLGNKRVKLGDTEDKGGTVIQQDTTVDTEHIPYYLKNFLLVLDVVLSDDLHDGLFDVDDLQTVERFRNLGAAAQRLYVRLFQRQFRWIRKPKISYEDIAVDLSDTLCELVTCKLLMNESKLTDLETTLSSLPASEVKQLASSLKLTGCGTQQAQLVAAILKHSQRKNIASFFMAPAGAKGDTGTASMILRKAKSLLGPCYKLNEEMRAVFMRILMLFGLHSSSDDESSQLPLYQLLMSNMGRVKYPTYSVLRSVRIFADRENFLQYATSLQLERVDMRTAIEKKDYDQALAIYAAVKTQAHKIFSDSATTRRDMSLPSFLRVFTAGSVYARFLTIVTDTLEHKRQYREAVCLLEQLLEQQTYQPDYRGLWYDRLALDLDHHLGQRAKALDVIRSSLADNRVRTGHRYSLLQRAHKICHSAANKNLKNRWVEFMDDPMNLVKEVTKVTIECVQPALPGTGPLYISANSSHGDNVTFLTRVEDAALEHYSSIGFPLGVHGEGGTFRYLFALFFWDILFTDGIPDVFYNAYQAAPLDIYTDHFFESRRRLIEDRLQCIMISDPTELESMLEESLQKNRDTFCIGVNWQMFTNDSEVKGLVRCMGGRILAGIFERLARDMRHTRSGLADLVVWNTETARFRIVEVKGPGDRLSSKQILWLDYLQKLGVATEVCHVRAVGAKKLR